jgi:two-component system response regulator TtrR
MNHVVAGYQNKDIADKLGISVKTVEVHRSNTMEKMQANSVVDLVRMYLIVNNNDETNYNYQ